MQKHKLMSQEVLQMYLFERVLERLAASEYKDNFILKGGLLISSMLGINERTIRADQTSGELNLYYTQGGQGNDPGNRKRKH